MTVNNIVLKCEALSHWFGSFKVLYDINLKIVRGEIVGLVGPSGCGKSTLLRAITGTHPPEFGQVKVMSHKNGNGCAEHENEILNPTRDIGIVYQQYSLFPFLTATQNVAFGLMLDQTSIPYRFFKYPSYRKLRKKHLEQAEEILVKFGLEDALNLYPAKLSGGMRQRVAIAQALVMKPEILLLDEPFGALDEVTREELQRMLLTLYLENCQAKQNGKQPPYTILMVTHELKEALYVSDRVLGLSQYWNWKNDNTNYPGATIIYDKTAPVYQPNQTRDYEALADQAEQIREVVFDPNSQHERNEFRQFWQEVNEGVGEGVLKNEQSNL